MKTFSGGRPKSCFTKLAYFSRAGQGLPDGHTGRDSRVKGEGRVVYYWDHSLRWRRGLSGHAPTVAAPVIAGHFGFAAWMKAKEPRAPLWALMVAVVFLDIAFIPLFLAGIEPMAPIPGARAGAYGQVVIHADYTHSLLGALVLSAAFGGLFAAVWSRRVGVVLALAVFSHWLLDLPMHRGDMPLLPGHADHLPLLGFGLWRWPVTSAALELLLVVLGAGFYLRAALRNVRDPAAATRANTVALLLLVFGVVTLGLNLAGL